MFSDQQELIQKLCRDKETLLQAKQNLALMNDSLDSELQLMKDQLIDQQTTLESYAQQLAQVKTELKVKKYECKSLKEQCTREASSIRYEEDEIQ